MFRVNYQATGKTVGFITTTNTHVDFQFHSSIDPPPLLSQPQKKKKREDWGKIINGSLLSIKGFLCFSLKYVNGV